MRGTLTRGALVSAFVRSFAIQGSWNYHTMLGSGFAFALVPGLRRLYADDPAGFEAALDRHLEHFNAHPYLASVAVGAALRLESEETDPELVRRFKVAVRGPLGSLGDTLVWATWLPLVSVAALCAYWLGAPGPWAAFGFLVVYNVGHLTLRVWGIKMGLDAGRRVAERLTRANLMGWVARARPVATLLLGVLTGALLGSDRGMAGDGALWVAVGAGTFFVGLLGGHRVWRPAAALTVAAVAAITLMGVVR